MPLKRTLGERVCKVSVDRIPPQAAQQDGHLVVLLQGILSLHDNAVARGSTLVRAATTAFRSVHARRADHGLRPHEPLRR